MQGDGEPEYEDYQAECDAEAQAESDAAEAEGEYLAQVVAEAKNEDIRAQEEYNEWLELLDKSSLLYWYPKIKDLGILTPDTEIIVLDKQDEELIVVCDGDLSVITAHWDEIINKANKIGFPLFMRTDEFSGKHHWKDTCYVTKEEDLKQHIYNLFEESFCASIMGLPLKAIVFRKYIPMANLFKAFYGEMPVNPELRFFVKDGKVLCWHWYWVEDAIERGTKEGILPIDWKNQINQAKDNFTESEISQLTKSSQEISNKLPGCWSVDFCLSKENKWILIDMAEGHKSWHPEDCEMNKIITQSRETRKE